MAARTSIKVKIKDSNPGLSQISPARDLGRIRELATPRVRQATKATLGGVWTSALLTSAVAGSHRHAATAGADPTTAATPRRRVATRSTNAASATSTASSTSASSTTSAASAPSATSTASSAATDAAAAATPGTTPTTTPTPSHASTTASTAPSTPHQYPCPPCPCRVAASPARGRRSAD
ncbi:unnamed protein product [Closterium sp. NIES-64]|nr:unnamed protein product [Closterium sp. NIES-64]